MGAELLEQQGRNMSGDQQPSIFLKQTSTAPEHNDNMRFSALGVLKHRLRACAVPPRRGRHRSCHEADLKGKARSIAAWRASVW